MDSDFRRALVFLLYDADGLCDESVLDTLKGFRPYVESILVVVNGSLRPGALKAVTAVADRVLERPNVGYDVGAYRDALELYGWDELAELDELLLVNYTFFGPVGTFGPLFERMVAQTIDFWGVTDHPSVTPHPYTGHGTMPAHLQSYWLGVRGRMLRDQAFRDYWHDLPDPTSYSDVVTLFECQFTSHFAALGYTWQAAFPAENYGVTNTTMEAPLALLEDGCPLFKKRLYFHDVPALVDQGIATAAITRQAERMGYRESLIVAGVVRRATTRELTQGLGASFIRTTNLARNGVDAADSTAPVVGIKEVQRCDKPWKVLAEDGIDALLGDAQILLVAPRPPKPGLRADGIRLRYRNATEAITADPQFISQVFRDHPQLGALYPYVQVIGTVIKGRKWFVDSQVSVKLASTLGLKGPFTQTSPVAPYRGAAAYRREVVELIAEAIEAGGGWNHLSEECGGEDLLHHMLDLLSADIAREGGYFVGETGSVEEAQIDLLLVIDMLSHTPKVYRDYTHYPYSGRVVVPTIKNRIGKAVQNVSPKAFDRLHDIELQLRSTVGGLRRVGK